MNKWLKSLESYHLFHSIQNNIYRIYKVTFEHCVTIKTTRQFWMTEDLFKHGTEVIHTSCLAVLSKVGQQLSWGSQVVSKWTILRFLLIAKKYFITQQSRLCIDSVYVVNDSQAVVSLKIKSTNAVQINTYIIISHWAGMVKFWPKQQTNKG